MKRKLASVQKVESVEPIEGSDFIEKIRVLGWTLVAKKDEFEPGDPCIYFEVDSILPEKCPVYGTDFSFMEKSKYRVKARKIRGIVSMGLAIPIPDPNMRKFVDGPSAGLYGRNWIVGEDVTEEFGVQKWEPPIMSNHMDPKGSRPPFVPKTDETRIQSIPEILQEISEDQEFYAAVKYDGTSGSFYYMNSEFGVTSRNTDLKENPQNFYWEACRRYEIDKILKSLNQNIVIQGEVCGPKIQKNRLNLPRIDLFVFDVFDIDRQEYYGYEELFRFTHEYQLKMVEVIPNFEIHGKSVDEIVEQAKGKYESGKPREGIVIRPKITTFSPTLKERFSFKAINPDFLLKEK